MNLDLWLDSLAVMTVLGPKRMVEPSVQFISEVNSLEYW